MCNVFLSHNLYYLQVFKQTSRAPKLLALVPPMNALSDVKNQTSSDEEVVINTCLKDSDELSSEAPSIPSSLENLNISEDDEDMNNTSGDEIPKSEPEDQKLGVPLTPIINQLLPSTSQVNLIIFQLCRPFSLYRLFKIYHRYPMP